MMKKLTALLLALTLAMSLLTGCSGTAAPTATTKAPEKDTALDVLDAGAREDVVDYLTDGALKTADTALTVDGVDVPASYYLYWIAYQATSLSQGGLTEEQLDTEVDSGKSVADLLKETSRDYVSYYYTMAKAAADEGVTLTEENQTEIEDYMSGLGEANLLYFSTDMAAQRTFYEHYLLGNALQEKWYGNESGNGLTDEDLKDYAAEQGYYTCRYILFPLQDGEGNALDSAEQKEKCQKAYEELSKVDSDKLEETFQSYQEKYNTRENGGDGNTEAFTSSTSSVVGGFADAVMALGENELGVTEEETEYGYFVILRLPLNLGESDAESMRSSYAMDRFDGDIRERVEQADVQWSELADNLDVKAFCMKLVALQEEIAAAETAAEEAAAADASAESSAE